MMFMFKLFVKPGGCCSVCVVLFLGQAFLHLQMVCYCNILFGV